MPFRRCGRAAGVFLAAFAFPPMAVHAATMTTTVELSIIEPFTVVKLADLEFGSMFAGTTAGTVTINPNTLGRTMTGGVSAAPGSFNPAEFITRGAPNRRVIVRLPSGPVTLSRIGGGGSMTVTNWTRNGAPPTSTPLGPDGLLQFRVGGRLNVGANQMPGRYTGSFSIEVQYQ